VFDLASAHARSGAAFRASPPVTSAWASSNRWCWHALGPMTDLGPQGREQAPGCLRRCRSMISLGPTLVGRWPSVAKVRVDAQSARPHRASVMRADAAALGCSAAVAKWRFRAQGPPYQRSRIPAVSIWMDQQPRLGALYICSRVFRVFCSS